MDFCSKVVGFNLSCIHTVTQMLANNYERSDVQDVCDVSITDANFTRPSASSS
ncbi:hypothetical protein AB205_0178670 [Aquarana catesbeiana]|uniref:Uncharacterized protein n=1 Tax=Aquarana catesbeiana TaxID=8400 RepID=A0A2G9P943_AQUCT|nr:hypothetical protein AB205_0178670 [Aquarana catesbeiana]